MSLAGGRVWHAVGDRFVVTVIIMISRTSLHSVPWEAPEGPLQEPQDFLEGQGPWRSTVTISGQLRTSSRKPSLTSQVPTTLSFLEAPRLFLSWLFCPVPCLFPALDCERARPVLPCPHTSAWRGARCADGRHAAVLKGGWMEEAAEASPKGRARLMWTKGLESLVGKGLRKPGWGRRWWAWVGRGGLWALSKLGAQAHQRGTLPPVAVYPWLGRAFFLVLG